MASTPDRSLDAHAVETLTAMARVLYPHDFLDDAPYRQVVDIVAEQADAAQSTLLADGVAALDGASDRSFLDLAEKERLVAVQTIERSPFFETMRAATVRHLYSNPAVWRHFGYEGPSHHLGGYIDRGFDDIDWITEDDVRVGE